LDYALIFSVLILIAAPILAHVVRRLPAIKAGLDGFVLLTVIGLIAMTLLPEALNHSGLWGLGIAITAFALPWIAEAMSHKSEEMTHRILMLVTALALVVHAASDGAILAYAKTANDGAFIGFGIILHRVGVAVAVWWLLRPVLTTFGGIAVLAALGAMTVVGYMMVLFAGEWYDVPLIGYWQAFAAGSMFHVVMHPLEDHDTKPTEDGVFAHRIGTVLGIVFVMALVGSHYLQHMTPSLGTIPVHNTHHDMDLLASVGRFFAPIGLLIMVAVVAYRRLSRGGMASAYVSLQQVTPWLLVIWFGLSVAAKFWPAVIPSTESGNILLSVWLAAVAAVLVKTGARAFFAVLIPRMASHNHDSKHSHSHR